MPEKQVKLNVDRKYWVFALKIIGDFGATIAVPLVLLVLVGRRLDEHFHHVYFFTVIAFFLSAVISGKMIYSKAKVYGKQYQDIDKLK